MLGSDLLPGFCCGAYENIGGEVTRLSPLAVSERMRMV